MSQSESQSTAVLPPPLRRGDTVAVVAPAGPVPEDSLRAGLEILAQHYQVRCDLPGLLSATGFLAGDDDRRADELNRALTCSDVRAIFVARGGYGSMRILDRLDADALRRDPVAIVGFSDVTALLSWSLTQAGVCGVHGPVLRKLSLLPASDQQGLFDCLASPGRSALDELVPISAADGADGADGAAPPDLPLIGGNLCILAHLVGTPYYPDTRGALMLLEDVGERPYAVDRYLTRMHLAGAFEGLRGFVLGDFVECGETQTESDPDVWAVLAERAAAFGLPAWRGLPVGHGDRNRALWLGC